MSTDGTPPQVVIVIENLVETATITFHFYAPPAGTTVNVFNLISYLSKHFRIYPNKCPLFLLTPTPLSVSESGFVLSLPKKQNMSSDIRYIYLYVHLIIVSSCKQF